MIALLDNDEGDLDEWRARAWLQRRAVADALSPGITSRDPRIKPWAIDNGAFSNFSKASFLEPAGAGEEHHREKVICSAFVTTAPDVPIGRFARRNARGVTERWAPTQLARLAAGDCLSGRLSEHLPMPWDAVDAVFIGGGSTNWKCSIAAVQIICPGRRSCSASTSTSAGSTALNAGRAFRQARRRQRRWCTGIARYSCTCARRSPTGTGRRTCSHEMHLRNRGSAKRSVRSTLVDTDLLSIRRSRARA